nr:hypothetical protein [uncultured Acetatifactor sp.]
MRESMFIRLFAGVPSDCFGAIPLVPLGWWLLSIGAFLLAAGIYAERDRKLEALSLYRYRTVEGWWKRRFGKGLLSGIRTTFLFLLLVLSWDIAMGNISLLSPQLLAKIIILWLFHSVSMAALFVLLDLFPVRRFAPGTLFLLEGVTFIIGCQFHAVSHVMYGMWGMYLQSSLYGTEGFPAGPVIAAEAVLPAAGFLIGRKYLKKGTDFV